MTIGKTRVAARDRAVPSGTMRDFCNGALGALSIPCRMIQNARWVLGNFFRLASNRTEKRSDTVARHQSMHVAIPGLLLLLVLKSARGTHSPENDPNTQLLDLSYLQLDEGGTDMSIQFSAAKKRSTNLVYRSKQGRSMPATVSTGLPLLHNREGAANKSRVPQSARIPLKNESQVPTAC